MFILKFVKVLENLFLLVIIIFNKLFLNLLINKIKISIIIMIILIIVIIILIMNNKKQY